MIDAKNLKKKAKCWSKEHEPYTNNMEVLRHLNSLANLGFQNADLYVKTSVVDSIRQYLDDKGFLTWFPGVIGEKRRKKVMLSIEW